MKNRNDSAKARRSFAAFKEHKTTLADVATRNGLIISRPSEGYCASDGNGFACYADTAAQLEARLWSADIR